MTKKASPAVLDMGLPEKPPIKGETAHELWRPPTTVDKITAYLDKYKEPGYTYKGVIMNYRGSPVLTMNVQEHEKRGYEIVYTTHNFSDDRAFSPDNAKKDSAVPGPVIKTGSDGHQYLLMRISDEQERKNKLSDAKREQERYKKSVGHRERKADGSVYTDGGYVDLNNPIGDVK